MDGTGSGESPAVTVVVTRTGGIAGMTRRWQVDSRGDEATEWVALIEECPWSHRTSPPTGADRFVWSIAVRLGPRHHDAELSDEEIDGPWRSLVEAVRERGDTVPPAPRPAPSPAPTAAPS